MPAILYLPPTTFPFRPQDPKPGEIHRLLPAAKTLATLVSPKIHRIRLLVFTNPCLLSGSAMEAKRERLQSTREKAAAAAAEIGRASCRERVLYRV